MAYLGNTPTTQSFISGTDYFNGDGSTTAFTLSRTVNSINDIQATVNNVVQQPNTAYTLSGTTITFTSAPSAGTGNIYVRYLSTTTQSITPSQNTVSWNTLDTNTQNDLGISFKNRIINGNMVIDQRNAGASYTVPSGNNYSLDRWVFNTSQASKISVQQNAGGVTPPAGFSKYLGVTSLSSYTVGSSESFSLQQRIEGLNVADLNWGTVNAKTITLSAWVYSSITGTFGGSIENATVARAYPFSYSISAANTWTKISITIPGDTTGTWATDNTTWCYLNFGLGVGSTLSGTAGAWASTDYRSSTGATSIVGTNGATWYITGVQLEVGTQATTFDYRDYGRELMMCQRYCYRTSAAIQPYTFMGVGYLYATTLALPYITHPITMRTTPTLTAGGSLVINAGNVTFSISALTGNQMSQYGSLLAATIAGGTNGWGCGINSNNDSSGYLQFSAEL